MIYDMYTEQSHLVWAYRSQRDSSKGQKSPVTYQLSLKPGVQSHDP